MSSAQLDNGQPFADPAYCKALPDLIKPLEEKVIPEQERMLRQQEARLQEAEAGNTAAQVDLAGAVVKAAMDLGSDQVTRAKELKKRVEAMKHLTPAQRREWLERIKGVEDSGKLLKVFTSRHEYEMALRRNEDNLVNFMEFIDEMGAADLALKGLGNLLAPGVGGLVVNGIKVGLDVVYASLNARYNAQEAAQWRDNVERLRSAHFAVKDRVAGYRRDLEGGLCGVKVAEQMKNSPAPTAAQNTTAAAAPAKSGASTAKVVGSLAAIGGAGAATAIALNEYKKAQEEYQGFLDSLPPSGGSGNSGGSSGGSSGGGTGGSSASTIVSANVTCTLNSAGSGRNCNGTITARIGPSVTAGVALSALTTPTQIRGGVTPSTTGAGQTLVFNVTNFSTVPQCPSVSSVNFVRPPDTSVVFTSAAGPIRVTCN
jgi:hypothetical protein